MTKKTVLSWSGGKDSALALHEIRTAPQFREYEVALLLTTITEDYDRISMHGIRRILLEQQAESIGLPLCKVSISRTSSNDEYEMKMKATLIQFLSEGGTTAAFGDLFLEDIRKYREQNLSKLQMESLFPLWRSDTRTLANRFIALGFKAILCCVDTKALEAKFAGRMFDKELLEELPSSVDPCGENGEFHTFVFDGPIFRQPIKFEVGERVIRENRFCFIDLIPVP